MGSQIIISIGNHIGKRKTGTTGPVLPDNYLMEEDSENWLIEEDSENILTEE